VNEQGKAEFARTENYGHLDAFAALAMGLRHVDWRKDATPPSEFNPADYFVPPGMKRPLTGAAAVVNEMFRGSKTDERCRHRVPASARVEVADEGHRPAS
jgi:hypothetical protein